VVHLDDHRKASDHDCRWAEDRDSLLEAGRDCQLAKDVEVERRGELAMLPQAAGHRADLGAAAGLDREPADVGQAHCPDSVDPKDAMADHAERPARDEIPQGLVIAGQQALSLVDVLQVRLALARQERTVPPVPAKLVWRLPERKPPVWPTASRRLQVRMAQWFAGWRMAEAQMVWLARWA
jgi:hypothetical protein